MVMTRKIKKNMFYIEVGFMPKKLHRNVLDPPHGKT